MWTKLKKNWPNIKMKFKYFYTYFLFKTRPVVYYTSDTLRCCGKTWLVIKTAVEYKLPIITSKRQCGQYIKETAKIMKNKGIIKDIPVVYEMSDHLRGFGNIKAVIDDLDIKDYEILKRDFQNIEIIGGFVFTTTISKNNESSKTS